jgi:hypothetical protein
MNYTKPEVAVLGQAVRVIEGVIGKTYMGVPDGGLLQPRFTQPAYDLDE